VDELTRAQLAAVAEVADVAGEIAVNVWLRGGWAIDFYLGQVTRRHDDVDWFAWNDDLPRLVAALTRGGWREIGTHPIEQQRDLVRSDVELGFACLARGADEGVEVGGGPYAGAAWPARMLDDALLGAVGTVQCLVIAPAAQIEIKRMMPVWVPGMRRRPKDAQDGTRLEQALGHAPRQ